MCDAFRRDAFTQTEGKRTEECCEAVKCVKWFWAGRALRQGLTLVKMACLVECFGADVTVSRAHSGQAALKTHTY